MNKIQTRKIILAHALMFSLLLTLAMLPATNLHAAPNACLERNNGMALPADFTGQRYDKTARNSVFHLISAARDNQCSGLKLDRGNYMISRHISIPPGFHLKGTIDQTVPVSAIIGVDADGNIQDQEAFLIRITDRQEASYTVSRLLLQNVRIDMRGTESTEPNMVEVTRVVVFDTNYEGPQVYIDRVQSFEVSRSIFLRGQEFGGKGLKTDNSTNGRISENCFGGQPDPDGPEQFCPSSYFNADILQNLDDQGHFITAWNASEGLTDSRFEGNWVKGNTDPDVTVGYLSKDSNRDHGIYVKFADNITITQNRFEGWPFGTANGHLKVRNASNIKIRSNQIFGMNIDLRPSITPATQLWLRQSCTWIDRNEFAGGSVSYDAIRKSGASGDIDTQVWVTNNTFLESDDLDVPVTDYRIRRPSDADLHTIGSFWNATDNQREIANDTPLFNTALWSSPSESADAWWAEQCSQ